MWLITDSIRREIAQGASVAEASQIQYEASGNTLLSTAGDVARIEVSGTMTARPSWLAHFFGGGNPTYPEIINAVKDAEANPDINTIELHINSGGGTVEGLFKTLESVRCAKKRTIAIVDNMAASAAYALAAQADTIIATNKAAMFGSVGIVVDIYASENRVSITSSEAPNKRPDPNTEEGKAAIREELDALHALFVEDIAEGRGTTAALVNRNFGRGAMLVAADAKARGMIDSIENAATKAAKSGTTNNRKAEDMDLETLKAQHHDVYAAARAEGATSERKRVNAHLTLANASGDMKTALAAIASGVSVADDEVQAAHLAARINRDDFNARQIDDSAATTLEGKAESGQENQGDAVYNALAALLGGEA